MKAAIAILILLFFWACSTSEEVSHAQISIPDVTIEASESSIEINGALLLLNKKPFSGYLLEFNKSEGYKSITGYFNGKKEGKAEQLYTNGNLKEQRFYINNKKHGRHQGWWLNGNLKYDINFDHGLTQGESKEWYADGSPFKVFHYEQGHELGSQKLWELNGSIRANYVVKNGHRYGLIGLKNCKSVEKEDGSLAAIAY